MCMKKVKYTSVRTPPKKYYKDKYLRGFGALPGGLGNYRSHRDPIAGLSVRERNLYHSVLEPLFKRGAFDALRTFRNRLLSMDEGELVRNCLKQSWAHMPAHYRSKIFAHFEGRELLLVGLIEKCGGPREFAGALAREKRRLAGDIKQALAWIEKHPPAHKVITLDNFMGKKGIR